MNKQANKFAYGVVGGLLLAICSFSAQAVDRYSKDSRGVIPMNAYGECWKTTYGIPPTVPCGAVLDSDGDGVLDDKDRCPDTPKGVAVDMVGCPLDSDGDGVVDMHDQCPDTPKGAAVDTKGCQLDSDGDGVVDMKDQCPNTPKGAPVNAVGCPLDTDGDGVYDYMDKCPGTPKGAKVDADGCMFEIVLNNVLFETNSADLKPESKRVLDGLADVLNGRPDVKGVTVIGHTDSMGAAGYNMGLSERRAAAVASYLSGKGISRGMLSSKGMGESDPVASNDNTEGRMMNRRVVFEIAR